MHWLVRAAERFNRGALIVAGVAFLAIAVSDVWQQLFVLAAAVVIGVPLAFVAFSLAVALWLVVLGYFVAGWPGAFVGGCTMLILNTVKVKSTTEPTNPRPVREMTRRSLDSLSNVRSS